MTNSLECIYCHTLNPADNKSCSACGAPISEKQAAPLDLTPKVTVVKPQPKPKPKPKTQTRPEETLRKVGDPADKLYNTAVYTYSVVWRTFAEAISIAVSAFIIGMVGGATDMRVWGVLFGIVVGFAVGRTSKNFYVTLISAPFGALLGLAISVVFWVIGWVKVPVFIAGIAAVAAAGLGGRPWERRRQNFWENARPFLGALGGLFFAIPGMLVGWGLIATIQELIQ